MKKNRLGFKVAIFLCAMLSIIILGGNQAFSAVENKDWKIVINEKPQLPNKIWKINFSMDINESTATKENIYVTDLEGNRFEDIEIQVIDSNIVQVVPKTEYKQGQTYFLCIDTGVKTKAGTSVKPYKLQFSIEKLDSDLFKIRNIDVVSDNCIKVYFTQPIDDNAKLGIYYEIYKDGQPFVKGSYLSMDVKVLKEVDNGVAIVLKQDKLQKESTYTIKILGDFISGYGARLMNGEGDQKDFNGTFQKSEDIKLLSAQPIANNAVEITFNNLVDEDTAKNIKNYDIRDTKNIPQTINSISVDSKYKRVYLKLNNSMKEDELYTIRVANVEDAMNKSFIKDNKYSYTYNSSVNQEIRVDSAAAIDRNVVEVYLNKKPQYDSAINPSNYYITVEGDTSNRMIFPNKVFYDPTVNPYKVKLFFSNKLTELKIYNFYISTNMKDEFGNRPITKSYYQFQGTDIEKEPIHVTKAVMIGSNHIKLTFSEEIFKGGVNLDPSNYLLEYSESGNRKIIFECSGVKYVNPNTLILNINDMSFDENYILKIKSISEYWGTVSNAYENGVRVEVGK